MTNQKGFTLIELMVATFMMLFCCGCFDWFDCHY